MNVEQYIYTRLSAENSPKKTTGYQSAFLPEGLKDRIQAVSLESHIHLNSGGQVLEKRTVFWLEIDREYWQVILFIMAMPEARDEFGRGGLYMVHGFLIPPDVWPRYSSPLRLASTLERYIIPNLTALFSSASISIQKGTIAAIPNIVWPEGDAQANDLAISRPKRQLLIFLSRILSGLAKGHAIVVRGNHRQAETLFAQLSGFLPNGLKIYLSWDSAFDEGKLFFAPHNLVAYSYAAPVTGSQLLYWPEQDRIEFSDAQQEALAEPFDPFTRWLNGSQAHDLHVDQIETYYKISHALTQKLPIQGLKASREFAEKNVQDYRQWLLEATDPMLAEPWRGMLARQIKDHQLVELAVHGFSDTKLADAVADLILENGLHPGNLRVAPPGSLAQVFSPKFLAVNSLWTQTPIKPEWLYDIVIDDREKLLQLYANHGMERTEASRLGFSEEEMGAVKWPSAARKWLGKLFGR